MWDIKVFDLVLLFRIMWLEVASRVGPSRPYLLSLFHDLFFSVEPIHQWIALLIVN